MCLVGTSLGGTVALDFAIKYPEAVDRLVLVAPQGYIDGIGPMASMPRIFSQLGIQVDSYLLGLAFHLDCFPCHLPSA